MPRKMPDAPKMLTVVRNDPDHIYLSEKIAELKMLCDAREASQWEIGDKLLEITSEYGASVLKDAARQAKISLSSAKQYRWVADQYEKGTRVPHLSWAHHMVAARHPDRLDLLKKAAAEGWSKESLRVNINPQKVNRLTNSAQDHMSIEEVVSLLNYTPQETLESLRTGVDVLNFVYERSGQRIVVSDGEFILVGRNDLHVL